MVIILQRDFCVEHVKSLGHSQFLLEWAGPCRNRAPGARDLTLV